MSRPLHCYLLLSLWIVVIVAGMYRYIVAVVPPGRPAGRRGAVVDSELWRLVRSRCDAPPASAEGLVSPEWRLRGVVAAIRHGDRGPLTHVRGIDSVDCEPRRDAPGARLLSRYRAYIENATASGKAPWAQTPGPFHNFPLLPPAPAGRCRLGQLTPVGVQQLLLTGETLGRAYGWDERRPSRVVVHSTRYRRALQSALALTWAALGGGDAVAAAALLDSPSLSFCETECACPAADEYAGAVSRGTRARLRARPAVVELVSRISKAVSESPSRTSDDPNVVEDALLAYLCHSAPLPCGPETRPPPPPRAPGRSLKAEPPDFDAQMEREKLGYYRRRMADEAEADYGDAVLVRRNVDADFNFAAGEAPEPPEEEEDEGAAPAEAGCVRPEQAAALLAYADWETGRSAESAASRRAASLRAYGMVRRVVEHVLAMISEGGGPAFVLFSGHDKTLRYLGAALGVAPSDLPVRYASRAALEVYERVREGGGGGSGSGAPADFFFRLVWDGRDRTDRLPFCGGGRVAVVAGEGAARLCGVEELVRFAHEDYFAPLNATNFKDACSVRTV